MRTYQLATNDYTQEKLKSELQRQDRKKLSYR